MRGAKMLSRRKLFNAFSAFIFLVGIASVSVSFAGPREQAKRMHDRLAGVPPTEAVLSSMTAKIQGGNVIDAAMEAMDNPAFINTTIKDWATPWTNRDQSVYRDLNDSTAMVMGFVRDDIPYDQILSADIAYIGSVDATTVAYEVDSNDHYRDLQNRRRDLSDPTVLIQMNQSVLNGLGSAQTAGIMTTRGYAEAFLVAGTNRAALRFATLNFMCMDMENFRDKSAYPDRVRQDVDRSPGGDSKIFMNDCLTCHAGMDSLAGAFAYYDFDEEMQRLVYTAGVVQPKYSRDAGVFRTGFETTGDSWVNYWRSGPNAWVGWNAANGGVGRGAKELGIEIAQTRQFSECQVKKAFEKVCHRSPNGSADVQAVRNIANSFEANNRSMKRVFAETAAHCRGN